MFKITNTDTFTWPVKLRIPVDGGRHIEAQFDAKFRRLSRDDVQRISETVMQGDDKAALKACREILVDWSGVQDDSGDVPFSEAALDRVLEVPTAPGAIIGTFLEASFGVERKN